MSTASTSAPQQPLSWPPPLQCPSTRGIGIVGCGSIAAWHLRAYRKAGLRVLALCDLDPARASDLRKRFYPRAAVHRDFQSLLADPSIEVVDIATHPHQRPQLIEAALLSRKHVLSQKPFVLDLAVGRKLRELAQQQQVLLAVNHNARWSPHWSLLRHAASAGWLGDIASITCSTHFDHSWVAGTPFDDVRHLLLYDFAIHWFDLVACLMHPARPGKVHAQLVRSPSQVPRPSLMGQVTIEYPSALVTLVFDGDTKLGGEDRTLVRGSQGTYLSTGPDHNRQRAILHRQCISTRVKLRGKWFPDAFAWSMAELLRAIEANRSPEHDPASAMRGLELCFAAVASADQQAPVQAGTVAKLTE